MDELNLVIKDKILDYLKNCDGGASSSQIAKDIGHNRVTVSKYLEIMKAEGTLEDQTVAQARLWSISKDYGKRKILIVDDEPHIVNLIKISLSLGPYKCIEAFSGMEALKKVDEEIPDLIILDIMMPGMSGYEFCEKIRKNPLLTHVPILVLSAKSDVKDRIKGIELGADDYMIKPFDPMELESRVNMIMRRINKDHDMDNLTGLPTYRVAKKHINSLIGQDKNLVVLKMKLKTLDAFEESYGIKRGDEVLDLTARMFKDVLDKEVESPFIAHISREQFICAVEKDRADDLANKLESAFKDMLPFIYNEDSSEDGATPEHLTLKVDVVSLEDVNKHLEGVTQEPSKAAA